MRQTDMFSEQPRAGFVDTRNQRDSVAEKKAELSLRLGELINKAPPARNIDTIGKVREYKRARGDCAKVAGNSRSSVNELSSAISRMELFWTTKDA